MSLSSRLESTASSLYFPGAWFSELPEGRASLEVAAGEFTPSKNSPALLTTTRAALARLKAKAKGRAELQLAGSAGKPEVMKPGTMDAAKALKEEKVVLEHRTRELERENERLEAKLAQVDDKISLRTAESTREHEELLTLRAKYEKTRAKLTQLRDTASQDHSELDALREQIVELRDANDGFEKHTNELQEKYDKVETKVKGLREIIAQHEETIADLTVRVAELRGQPDANHAV
uniref:Uncharacterized protein n=1 Tax=Mycena chlorophos TaxID=658473 RepID=A0ABQ0LRX4_MYCCL|nr:predicted protein [Mycena chlorophos]